jgi:hypothetical protein
MSLEDEDTMPQLRKTNAGECEDTDTDRKRRNKVEKHDTETST